MRCVCIRIVGEEPLSGRHFEDAVLSGARRDQEHAADRWNIGRNERIAVGVSHRHRQIILRRLDQHGG